MGKMSSKATPAVSSPSNNSELNSSSMEDDHIHELNFEILPYEIYGIITEYLPLTQLFIWRQTCTYFYDVCHKVLLQRLKEKIKVNELTDFVLKKYPSLLYLYYLRYIYPPVFNIQEIPTYKGRKSFFEYDQVLVNGNSVHTERFEWHGFWIPNAILQLPFCDFRDKADMANGKKIESFKPLQRKRMLGTMEANLKAPSGSIPCQSDVIKELNSLVSQICYRIRFKFDEIANNHLAGWLSVVGVGQRWPVLSREVFANDCTGYGFILSNFFKLCGDCQGSPFHNLEHPVQNGDSIYVELTIQRKRKLNVEEEEMHLEEEEEQVKSSATEIVSKIRVFHNEKDLGILFDDIIDVTQFCPYISLDGRRTVQVTIESITME